MKNLKFSFIDTPCPNEREIGGILKNISQSLMRNASAVVLVIDFTQITGEATQDIKKQIEDIFEIIENNNIFILVNKFDEIEKSSSELDSVEKVKKYLIDNFFKEKNISEDQILTISSRNAFYANWGLKNIDKLLEIDENKNENLKFFINNIIGNPRTWKKIKKDKKEIREYCLDALKESNLNDILKKIKELYEKSEKDILNISINVKRNPEIHHYAKKKCTI